MLKGRSLFTGGILSRTEKKVAGWRGEGVFILAGPAARTRDGSVTCHTANHHVQ